MKPWLAMAALVAAAPFAPALAWAECVETGGSGADRPKMVDAFPERGLSGYAAMLHAVIAHGRGETVLPRGLDLQSESDAARALRAAGFALPDQDARGKAKLSSVDLDPKGGRRETTLDVPLLLLPSEPGRHALELPPLPIAVARASGDLVTLCTKPHRIVVDDPTASTPHAQPKSNPPPRGQQEEWVALERGLQWGLGGALIGTLIAWGALRWLKRPRPAPPPPPPRVPWEVALERLDEARHAGLLETSRFSEFFDRVNDAVREYLGARFGFDGLESTTDETLAALQRVRNLPLPMGQLAGFLQQCDLVKFADVTPTLDECQRALTEAEQVVRSTIPSLIQPPAAPASEART
jgi:hypothetical protein